MWELLVPDAAAHCMHSGATAETAAPTFSDSCPFNYAVLALACMSKNPDDRPPLFQIQEVLQALNVEVTTGQSYLDWTGAQRVRPPLLRRTVHSLRLQVFSLPRPHALIMCLVYWYECEVSSMGTRTISRVLRNTGVGHVQDVRALGGAIAFRRPPTPQPGSVCSSLDPPLASEDESVDRGSAGNTLMESWASEKSVGSVSFYTSVDAASGSASESGIYSHRLR